MGDRGDRGDIIQVPKLIMSRPGAKGKEIMALLDAGRPSLKDWTGGSSTGCKLGVLISLGSVYLRYYCY